MSLNGCVSVLAVELALVGPATNRATLLSSDISPLSYCVTKLYIFIFLMVICIKVLKRRKKTNPSISTYQKTNSLELHNTLFLCNFRYKKNYILSKHRPSVPMLSKSQFVHMCFCVFVCLCVHLWRTVSTSFCPHFPK